MDARLFFALAVIALWSATFLTREPDGYPPTSVFDFGVLVVCVALIVL